MSMRTCTCYQLPWRPPNPENGHEELNHEPRNLTEYEGQHHAGQNDAGCTDDGAATGGLAKFGGCSNAVLAEIGPVGGGEIVFESHGLRAGREVLATTRADLLREA
jgi:hypothetical protein